MSYRQKLVLLLIVISILGLVSLSANVYLLSEDRLVTLSFSMLCAYTFAYLAVSFYRKQTEPLEQLLVYVQTKQEGQTNISLNLDDNSSAFAELSKQLHKTDLSSPSLSKIQQNDLVFESVFKHWPMPVIAFDENKCVTFFNHAFFQKLNFPLLIGCSAQECGFEIENGQFQHSNFNQNWQTQNINIGQQTLFLAHNISDKLQASKQQSQVDLIRVLSHELNNSLTPMASMTDTLLQADSLPEELTREVLTRIRARSESLLKFVKAYAELSQLPQAKPIRTNLLELAGDVASEQGVELNYRGEHWVDIDPILFERVLINVFKNAKEASGHIPKPAIEMQVYFKSSDAKITITDNGSGFMNLENALTPFYTTKAKGRGLGLALCKDIVERHNGKLTAMNSTQGACIEITLPL
ncbi:MAG: GHKL domain-containing protein [Shewanella sp.]|nr:GHKL domain-containing protein [Shewanella sp.]